MMNTVFLLSVLMSVVILISSNDDKSPYNQHLPDCSQGFKRLQKKTKAKALLCPMIRDEEGFLSEWVAYYQMHGFDHFFIFDDSSVDNGLEELRPWINAGMVTVRSNWTLETLNVNHAFRRNEFKKAMTVKALLEAECKNQAIEWGYDFYVSLDVDEYMVPLQEGVTIVDELVRWSNTTNRFIYCIDKNNYPSTPHLLEPIDLLTIEAYQTRMPLASKMNYYTSVAAKCAYRLNGAEFSANTSRYIAECCHFHGCQGWDFRQNSRFCTENHKVESWRLSGYKRKWLSLFIINHYSRSLEKFALKSKTWRTATGEVKAGESSEQAAKGYDISKFFSRSVGWQHDPIAVKYSCPLRELYFNMTGQSYLRPGGMWYRNPEYGKTVTDADKRGRYGRPNPPGYKSPFPNPYVYEKQKKERKYNGLLLQ